jgi:hypothetical protein
MATKNINAEKIHKGNLDVSGISASTFNVNGQYDLPTNTTSNGDFFMYSGGSSSWNFIQESSITGTIGGTIPFVNSIGTDFEYKSGFNYDLNKLNITSAPNVGTSIHKKGGLSISGNSGGVITFSGYNSSLSAATVSSNSDLLLYATGTTPSVYGQDKQLYLSSTNPYVGINTITPQSPLHVKGVSNTTGNAFIVNKTNSNYYQILVYNNHDTINSGITYNSVGVNFNWYAGTSNHYAGLPTIGGENKHILVRVENPASRSVVSGKFNTFWHDYRQGNQFWYTGVTASGDTILYPSTPDVEFIYNPTDSSTYRNVFGYDTASKLDLESYDNLLVSYDGKFMSTSTYRRRMNRCLVVGALHEIGVTTMAPNIDNSFNVTNFVTYGTTNMINRSTASYYTTGVSDLEEKTSIKNFILGRSYETINCVRDGVKLVGTASYSYPIYAGENVFAIGGVKNFNRQRKQEPPYVNDTKLSLNVKNIWSLGGGFYAGHGNNNPFFDNTINIGTVSHSYLQGGSTYYANTPVKNIYDRPFPYQTKGIWIGTKASYNPDPVAGFWLDPLIEDNGNVNFGFGSYYPFYCDDTSQRLNRGLNRPDSGAGIFYLHKPYLEENSQVSVPISYYNNAVGLGNNEQYYTSPLSDAYHPAQNSSLVIHSGEGIIHLIGRGMYVNPVKEVIYKPSNTYSASTYQLSGSSAMLDVIGSGSTSSTTSVRIKNSGDTVGFEVLDGTTTNTPNAQDVYFNGIPTSDVGLTAGWLYKNGSGQLSIVPGASVAGNYCPSISSQHLELSLLSQTQVYSNAGTTVITDGSLVQQINDLSGNNNHAAQTNSGDRFNWNVSESTLNNYSYLSNSDTSRFMNLTNGISLSASTVDYTGFGINIVMRINSTDTFRLFESSTTTDFIGEFSYDVPNSYCDWTHSGSTASVTTAGSILYNLSDWAVFSFYISGGYDYLQSMINGLSNQGSYITSNVFRNLDKILVGGDIDVAEITIYNRPNISSKANGDNFVDIASEISRLMTKYNIT